MKDKEKLDQLGKYKLFGEALARGSGMMMADLLKSMITAPHPDTPSQVAQTPVSGPPVAKPAPEPVVAKVKPQKKYGPVAEPEPEPEPEMVDPPAKSDSSAEARRAKAEARRPVTMDDIKPLVLKLDELELWDELEKIGEKYGETSLSKVPEEKWAALYIDLRDALPDNVEMPF